MYNSNKDIKEKMDIIMDKFEKENDLTPEEYKFSRDTANKIRKMMYDKNTKQNLSEKDKMFYSINYGFEQRRLFDINNVDFEKSEKFMEEILEDVSASIKLASNENQEELTAENSRSPATTMLKTMLMSLEKKDYKTFNTYVDKFEEISNNPKYEQSKDLFNISLKSLKKIKYIGSEEVKDYDKLLGGIFQTFKYPTGKGLLDYKDGSHVMGISKLKKEDQKAIKSNLRNSLSKSAKKSLENSYYFSKNKGNAPGK